MRYHKLALGLMLLGLNGQALAADMAIVPKAQKVPILQTYSGKGSYFGVGTFAEVDKVALDGASTGSTNLYAAGAAAVFVGGYMWGDGTTWRAFELMAGYKNVGGSTPAGNGANVNATWTVTERVLLGGPIASVLDLLPNLSTVFPTIPAPPAGATSSHPYVFGALHQDKIETTFGDLSGNAWRIKAGFGVGAKHALGNAQNTPGASKIVMDTFAEYIVRGSGMTVGGSGLPISKANTGSEARVGMIIEY